MSFFQGLEKQYWEKHIREARLLKHNVIDKIQLQPGDV